MGAKEQKIKYVYVKDILWQVKEDRENTFLIQSRKESDQEVLKAECVNLSGFSARFIGEFKKKEENKPSKVNQVKVNYNVTCLTCSKAVILENGDVCCDNSFVIPKDKTYLKCHATNPSSYYTDKVSVDDYGYEIDILDNNEFIQLKNSLNWNIDNIEERIEHLYHTLNPNQQLHRYFQIYFDRYFKKHLTSKDSLSHDNARCKLIELMGKYLTNFITVEDRKSIKTKRDIFKNRGILRNIDLKKILAKEIPTYFDASEHYRNEFIKENYCGNQMFADEQVVNNYVNFKISELYRTELPKNKKNQKKFILSKNQKKELLKRVENIKYVKEGIIPTVNCLEIYINEMEGLLNEFDKMNLPELKLKLEHYKVVNKTELSSKIKKYKNILHQIQNEKYAIGEQVLRPIKFKKVEDDKENDGQFYNFDFLDNKQVKTLIMGYSDLKMEFYDDVEHNLNSLLYILEMLVDNAQLSDMQKDILIMKVDRVKADDIIEKVKERYDIKLTFKDVSTEFTKICKRVSEKYEEEYNNWYYLNTYDGDYKICCICNKWLPKTNDFFGKDTRNKDGYKSICKRCDAQSKKRVKYNVS